MMFKKNFNHGLIHSTYRYSSYFRMLLVYGINFTLSPAPIRKLEHWLHALKPEAN